ncbi:hypothetical protein DFH08DRAFT_1011952 [Mycena albidolilacea]|uniref:Secreted protein n=1 Tax=Mycena albidolilacea TaxID=1033008 RepID=A0AAD7EP95_9AGAR|nr:hypothetical protein DFH08DRAFT_1011952 [Mycena albidolilacea]
MRTSTLTLIAACILFVVDAAPLGARGSVEHLTTENQTDHVASEATPPPWRASSFVEMRVAQPTPPPWRRSMEAEAMGGSSQKGDAPGWRAVAASSVVEHVAQPTPPPWRRESESIVPPTHTGTHTEITDSSHGKADAPGWRKRVAASDADLTLALPQSA